jgi:hypothetical protein
LSFPVQPQKHIIRTPGFVNAFMLWYHQDEHFLAQHALFESIARSRFMQFTFDGMNRKRQFDPKLLNYV